MSEFKTYHPIVNFTYFAFVIGFSCFFMHPVCLLISLVSGFIYSVMLKGGKQIRKNLIYMIPMLLLTALINPLFNHAGVTVMAYLPGGNPLTLESVIYGLCAAGMIVSVICHFTCYNEVMTSDKFIYLFGKIIPSLSLILSMALRFVPRFFYQLKIVINAQQCLGRDVKSGSLIKRAICGLNILGIMASWSLENAVETADSMKSRGYGASGRTAFSIFKFDKRDARTLICILVLGIYTLMGHVMGGTYISFFPAIQPAGVSALGISIFLAYLLLCIYPVAIEIREVRRWKVLRSKI